MFTLVHAHDSPILPPLRALAEQPAWLLAATEPERVIAALRRHVPELADGTLTIRAGDADRLRFNGECWDAMYKLAIDGPGSDRRRDVIVAGTLTPPHMTRPKPEPDGGAFGDDAWHLFLPDLGLNLRTYPPDDGLAALPLLTDPEQARALLQTSIRACSPRYADITIAAAAPKIMRFKRGSRCTVLYRLSYAPEHAQAGWPDVVVAKTYRGDKGANAYDGMRKLWASPLARGDIVTIAEPLAYAPDLKVLVQGPIREELTLKELLRSALRSPTPAARRDLDHYMRLTARGLAALHQSGARHGEIVTWHDELAEIRAVLDGLAIPVPALALATPPLLNRLAALAALHPAEPPLPAHRAFRPAQVLIHAGRIGFIDFDGFCQAEPALDVALFRATIMDIGLNTPLATGDTALNDSDEAARRERLDLLDTIADAFLVAYESYAPISRQRVALWETLDLLTYVLHAWTKVKPSRLANTICALEHHVQRMGLR